jgi:F0F1-type ATP synthase membrane subunit a
MRDQITFFIVAIIYLAILYTLVKPQSKGPQLVQNVLGTLTDLVRGAAGQTYNPSTKQWSVGSG